MAGAGKDLADDTGDRAADRLSAEFLRRGQAGPALFDIGFIGIDETVRQAHAAVLQPRALDVARLVQRRDLTFRECREMSADLAREIRVPVRDALRSGDFIERKENIVNRRFKGFQFLLLK